MSCSVGGLWIAVSAPPGSFAGAADRDVSEFRAELSDFRRGTTASFNALGEDVTEGFAEMRGKLDATAAGQQQIVSLIQQVIEKEQ